MNVSDFDFDLPEELIAKFPPEKRGDSRLLVVEGCQDHFYDAQFNDLLDLIEPGDLLIFNNTKVVPARLFAQKQTGGKLEILFERKLDERKFLAHVRSSRSPKPGSKIILSNGVELTMVGRQGALFILELPEGQEVFELLESQGHIPLPPYIDREDEALDSDRYQTVFAQHPGSAAAPTAGLHFSQKILEAIEQKGAQIEYVTLHVGAGTFQPVKVDKISEHVMHSEWIDVPQNVVDSVSSAKKSGHRVIAVGTTSCRSLEAASQEGILKAYQGDTDIFIYPGYKFQTVDGLLTNFHLPQSTLLMLVSALAGQDTIAQAYQHAIEERYRFFSYGDAMFIASGKV